MQALAKGPLAITIWADSNPDLQLYSTGIYTPPTSPSAHEDHAITLIGYGTETLASGTQADYWIIKNRQAGWPASVRWLLLCGGSCGCGCGCGCAVVVTACGPLLEWLWHSASVTAGMAVLTPPLGPA